MFCKVVLHNQKVFFDSIYLKHHPMLSKPKDINIKNDSPYLFYLHKSTCPWVLSDYMEEPHKKIENLY